LDDKNKYVSLDIHKMLPGVVQLSVLLKDRLPEQQKISTVQFEIEKPEMEESL